MINNKNFCTNKFQQYDSIKFEDRCYFFKNTKFKKETPKEASPSIKKAYKFSLEIKYCWNDEELEDYQSLCIIYLTLLILN